jgi:16S rRNA processing protein RimM
VAGYHRIARVSRAKGLAGEVAVVPFDRFPLQVWEGLRLWIVPPDHDLIRETCVRAAAESKTYLLLGLEGVTERTTAQRLVGRYLLARVDDCGGQPDEDERDTAVGLTVVDEARGFLGAIVEERFGVAQTLWVVKGPFGEALIPAVDEFILSRDDERVCVRIPEGLLEADT